MRPNRILGIAFIMAHDMLEGAEECLQKNNLNRTLTWNGERIACIDTTEGSPKLLWLDHTQKYIAGEDARLIQTAATFV